MAGSPSVAEGAPTTVASSPSARSVASPIDALIPQLSDADARTLHEGERALIRQCMRAKGLDFTWPSYEQSAALEDNEEQIAQRASSAARAYANPVWARAHGYGVDADELRKQYSLHLGPETGKTLDQRTSAALYGEASDPVIEVTRPDGVVSMRAGGCFWQSQKTLYGDVKTWLELFNEINDLARDLHSKATADVAVSTALAQWRTCMGSRGWQSFQQQTDAFSFVVKAYRRDDPNARTIEFTVARADAECTVESKYATAKAAAEKRVAHEARSASSALIISFTQRQDAAVKAAAKALAAS